MATNKRSFIGTNTPTVPNNFTDNSGAKISQGYTETNTSTGTYSFIPKNQFEYINFTASLTGNLAIVATNATYSFVDGSVEQAFKYCGKLEMMLTGGASTYTVTLSTGFKTDAVGASFSVPANKLLTISAINNGTYYIANGTVTL